MWDVKDSHDGWLVGWLGLKNFHSISQIALKQGTDDTHPDLNADIPNQSYLTLDIYVLLGSFIIFIDVLSQIYLNLA